MHRNVGAEPSSSGYSFPPISSSSSSSSFSSSSSSPSSSSSSSSSSVREIPGAEGRGRETLKKRVPWLSRGQSEKIGNVFKNMESDFLKVFPRLFNSVIKTANSSGNKAVQVFLMHYLQKAASLEQGAAIASHRPVSPLGQQNVHYHRDYQTSNVLLTTLTQTAVEYSHGALESQDIICVSDKSSHIKTLKVFNDVIEVNSEDEIAGLIYGAIVALNHNRGLTQLYISIDKLVDPDLPFAERATKIQEITQRIAGGIPPKYIGIISQKIGLISTQMLGEQPLLIATAFHRGPLAYKDREKRTILREQIVTAGQAATMLQATHSLVQLNDFGALVEGKIPKTKSKVEEIHFESLQSLYIHPAVIGYGHVPGSGCSPGVELLAQANTNMLNGLRYTNLPTLLTDPEVGPIINSSLSRIVELMNISMQHPENHMMFSLCHELMAEEFLLLLNLSQPFQPGEFQAIYLSNRENALKTQYRSEEKLRPIHLENPPLVLAMASGMSCVDVALRGLQKGKPNLKVGGFRNGYFQTHIALSELKNDGEKASYQSISSQDGPAGTLAQFALAPPDLIYLDLRPAADIEAREYSVRDLSVIDGLLENRPEEAGPLTIALDVTLDKLHSKEIDDLVAHHQQAIAEGRLNIILFRSAQKFDQLGVDKFNAGHLELYTADPALRDTFQGIEGQLTGLDYQALCFYHKNADKEIHDYLKIHYKNTDEVYNNLQTTIGGPGSFLQITPKHDKKLTYIEFTYPALNDTYQGQFQDRFISYITAEAIRQGVPLFWRDSFGFNESTICTINTEKTRLSLGTHPQEDLVKICAIIKDCENRLRSFIASQGYDLENLSEEQTVAIVQFMAGLHASSSESSSSSSSL